MAKDEFDLSPDETTTGSVSARKPTINVWLILAIAACLFVGWKFYNKPQPQPEPDDQTIVDDEKTPPQPKPEPSIDLKGATLVYVLENLAPTADQTAIMLGVTTESLQAKGMAGFRRYDEEQPQGKAIIEYAIGRGVASPLVAIIKDKLPIKVAPFPANPAALEAFLR